MKRFIVAVGVVGLAGAAISGAACWRLMGAGTFDLRACAGPNFSITSAMLSRFDYAELRDTSGQEARVLESAGTKCQGAANLEACTKAVEDAKSDTGWNNGSHGRMPGHHYIVATKGDEVTVVTQVNLADVLKPIDSPIKAAVISGVQRNIFPSCEGSVRLKGSVYEVHLVSTSCFGPVDEVVSIDATGMLSVVQSEQGPATCVGALESSRAKLVVVQNDLLHPAGAPADLEAGE
ncbi:MAG: hypothetical protein JNM17_01695 [Archangium sp.]|nr:hypothetical protein [Archangium sp.]